VAAGGRRLADEVLQVREKYPSLESLALVGNSLGGLYVRYASTLLLDPAGDTIAGGLRPETLLTFCAPHLGVRTFTYLPLPAPHKSWIGWPSWWVAGTTGDDLLLRTTLLEEMSCPQSGHYRALRAVQRRRAYANHKGDFMVRGEIPAGVPAHLNVQPCATSLFLILLTRPRQLLQVISGEAVTNIYPIVALHSHRARVRPPHLQLRSAGSLLSLPHSPALHRPSW
jgi:hypothetical protein